jgi:8-oxo-dGTP pyrophosphatase MutT (NUDIX family)
MALPDRSLYFSDRFAISCGTVAIDATAEKVLLIRWRKTDEVFLPKGRKDIGESLEQAALRETFEETGVQVQLLPVEIKTLATIPSSLDASTSPTIKTVTEPIAVSQRVTNGQLKIIFWYVASGDSDAALLDRPHQENEDFDTVWVAFEKIQETVSFEDDLSIARAAIKAVQKGVVAA